MKTISKTIIYIVILRWVTKLKYYWYYVGIEEKLHRCNPHSTRDQRGKYKLFHWIRTVVHLVWCPVYDHVQHQMLQRNARNSTKDTYRITCPQVKLLFNPRWLVIVSDLKHECLHPLSFLLILSNETVNVPVIHVRNWKYITHPHCGPT